MDKKHFELAAVVLAVLLVYLSGPGLAAATTVSELTNRIEVKFRRVGTVFLRARGYPASNPSDTTQLILAYKYPDGFLQVLRGRQGREQVVLLSGDSLVINFPHLGVSETRVLEPERRAKVIARNFPMAGLAGLVRLDRLPEDRVEVRDHGETLSIRVNQPDRGTGPTTFRAVLGAESLVPKLLVAEGPDEYRLEIEYYEEDSRLPKPVVEAFKNLDPGPVAGGKL